MMSCNFPPFLIPLSQWCPPLNNSHLLGPALFSLFSQKAIAILVALRSSPQVWTFSFFCTQTCWSLLILTLAVSKFSNQIPNFSRKNWEQRTCGVWQFVVGNHEKSQIKLGPVPRKMPAFSLSRSFSSWLLFWTFLEGSSPSSFEAGLRINKYLNMNKSVLKTN